MRKKIEVRVKRIHQGASLPDYATYGSGCFDLYCHMERDTWGINAMAYGCLVAGKGTVFDTGLAFEIPAGYVMLIYSRSGHGFKNGVRLSNCVGIIDSDYRGEVKVKLTADPAGGLRVHHGDRIAQAMIVPVDRVEFILADELTETARGDGGFGSTGA